MIQSVQSLCDEFVAVLEHDVNEADTDFVCIVAHDVLGDLRFRFDNHEIRVQHLRETACVTLEETTSKPPQRRVLSVALSSHEHGDAVRTDKTLPTLNYGVGNGATIVYSPVLERAMTVLRKSPMCVSHMWHWHRTTEAGTGVRPKTLPVLPTSMAAVYVRATQTLQIFDSVRNLIVTAGGDDAKERRLCPKFEFALLFYWLGQVSEHYHPCNRIHICSVCNYRVRANRMAERWVQHVEVCAKGTEQNFRSGICGECRTRVTLFHLLQSQHAGVSFDTRPSLAPPPPATPPTPTEPLSPRAPDVPERHINKRARTDDDKNANDEKEPV